MSMRNILRIFLLPLVASFLPYMACELFSCNRPHGLLSFDVLFFVLFCCIEPKQKKIRLFATAITLLYAIIGGSVEFYISAAVYIALIWLLNNFPKKWGLRVFFAIFFLIVLICDAGVFFYNTYAMSMADIWGVSKFFWWGICLFVAIPCLQVLLGLLFARSIIWGRNPVKVSSVALAATIIIALGTHFIVGFLQNRQPILEFGIKEYVWQLTNPDVIGHNPTLQEDIKASIQQITFSELKLDFSKPMVMVLVESWGVNKNVDITKALLAPYDAVANKTFFGIGLRTESFTQGAEFEDFETNQERTISERFKQNGFNTIYLHGYDGDFYKRNGNYQKYGFDNLFFKEDFEKLNLRSCKYGFTGICDSSIAVFIDSLLNDSIPKFIYWTTLDGHLPYEGQVLEKKSPKCDDLGLNEFECVYFTRQENTARYVANLIQKHPDVNFIVRGDHRPPGSVVHPRFSANYYYRWVPTVIVNGT